MATAYILYSKNLDKYYIGSCLDLAKRLQEHKDKIDKQSFTYRTDDWEIYYVMTGLSYSQARSIEQHIKKMKSKKYIENLKKYPELSDKLRNLYD
jgi:putative endonuclease